MTSSFYIRDNEDVENDKPKIAKSLFAKGDYSGALKIYLDIASASFSHKIFCEIGKCYYKLKNFDDAKVNFEHSISLEPARNISYLYLGNIYSLQNKTELAIENWITFFSFKPEESSVSLNLARAYLNKNMKFLSDLFFEKYLKYAPQKDSELYIEIQQTFENALKREGVFGVLNAAAQLHLSGEKGAYKYALKYIRDKEIPHNDLQVIIPTLINIMLLDPKYGKYVTSYLKRNLDSINIDTLTVVINKELASSLHGELQQETLLFIQLIRDLGLNITANNIEGVLLSDNDFAIIIALDIWKNRNKAVVRTRQEARRINDSVKLLAQKLEGEKLSGSRWLLVYETTMHGFLSDYSLKDEDMDDFFKKLKECNITFYNSIKSE